MNLSVQNHVMNNNRYALVQKPAFKGQFLTSKSFAAEPEILAKIKTLPESTFIELTEFLNFCRSIDITPKITSALTKRLMEVRQTKVSSKFFIG